MPHQFFEMKSEWDAFANHLTSVNTYVDVGVWPCAPLKTKTFTFGAITNDVKVQVLGSLDGGTSYPLLVIAPFVVAAAGSATHTVTDFYSHLKVQVQPNVAATHGTLSVQYGGASW